MRRSCAPFLLLVLLALALAPLQATRADPIGWTYDWTPGVLSLDADVPGTGTIAFSDSAPGSAAGSTDIVTTNLTTLSTAPVDAPDQLSDGPYSLTLTLTDDASGESGSLVFGGILSGDWSSGHANIANAFKGDTTQGLELGDNLYSVTIGPYSPPGPPTSDNAGSISAFVSVEPLVTVEDPPIESVPEPSTALLAGLGLSVLGGHAWWRRRPRPA